MLELTQELGFYPNLSDIDQSYFDLENGYFCSHATSQLHRGGDTIVAFKQLLRCNFDTLGQIKISNTTRNDVLGLLIDYFNLHLLGFGKIKSVDILHEVFK